MQSTLPSVHWQLSQSLVCCPLPSQVESEERTAKIRQELEALKKKVSWTYRLPVYVILTYMMAEADPFLVKIWDIGTKLRMPHTRQPRKATKFSCVVHAGGSAKGKIIEIHKRFHSDGTTVHGRCNVVLVHVNNFVKLLQRPRR